MKNKLHVLIGIVAGSLTVVSCGTYNMGYVDDIYYNPNEQSTNTTKVLTENVNVDRALLLDETETDTSAAFLSNYDEYEYAERLNKFHDDDYQGDYYDTYDQNNYPNYNLNVNYGFSPWGMSWGMGFGIGYGFYDSWYNPYYSWSPYGSYYGMYGMYGYPYYGYHSPYYGHYGHHGYLGCGYYGSYYDYYPHYSNRYDDERGYYYGPRHSTGSGSITLSENDYTGSRKNTDVNGNYDGRGQRNSNFELQEDLAPMQRRAPNSDVASGKSKELTRTAVMQKNNDGSDSKAAVALTRDQNASFNTTRVSTRSGELSKNPAVSRQEALSSKVSLQKYSRTKTEALKKSSASPARKGYVPSYTRTRTSVNRNNYNSGSGNSARSVNTVKSSSTSSTVKSSSLYKRNTSSSNTYKRYSNTSNSTQRSSYSAPSRNNTPSRSSNSTYTAPKRSSSSSYSAPKRSTSSYSSPSRSSSGSSSGSSRSSGSSGSSSKTSGSLRR